MKKFSIFMAPLVTLIFVIAGCASNIEHIPDSQAKVPTTQTFNDSYEKVWNAAQHALSEEATFKILDKSSGIMVTEFRTIDSKELSVMQTTFLGKTYKSNYTLNFKPLGKNKTEVRINIKIQAVQVGFFSREESLEDVESYLRQKLFDNISSNLKS